MIILLTINGNDSPINYTFYFNIQFTNPLKFVENKNKKTPHKAGLYIVKEQPYGIAISSPSFSTGGGTKCSRQMPNCNASADAT